MKIEIMAESIHTNDETLNIVSDFFIVICKALQFSDNDIVKVIFADDTNYGSAIKEIDQNENYTNTKDHTGFGKTITVGNGKSIIILNICFFQILVKIINSNDFQSYPNLLYIHLISHEIGHCIQNSKHNFLEDISLSINSDAKSKYYYSILVDEYMANRNICPLYNENDVLTELETFYIDDLIKFSDRYYSRSIKEDKVISNFWILHIQFAKIAALLIDFSTANFESTLSKINSCFCYEEVLETYNQFSKKLINNEDLFYKLLSYR